MSQDGRPGTLVSGMRSQEWNMFFNPTENWLFRRLVMRPQKTPFSSIHASFFGRFALNLVSRSFFRSLSLLRDFFPIHILSRIYSPFTPTKCRVTKGKKPTSHIMVPLRRRGLFVRRNINLAAYVRMWGIGELANGIKVLHIHKNGVTPVEIFVTRKKRDGLISFRLTLFWKLAKKVAWVGPLMHW